VRYYEEPQLSRTFGESYREYQARVGRWLPRIGRGSSG
jgi:protein-S-isoprenylcysteine O-methyltransferase Ste14